MLSRMTGRIGAGGAMPPLALMLEPLPAAGERIVGTDPDTRIAAER
jgi:hypothetical protein